MAYMVAVAEAAMGEAPSGSLWGATPEQSRSMALRQQDISAMLALRALICSYSWPCDEALRVVACESSNSWSAYNNGNYGGFQVNQVHVDKLERVTGSRDLDLLFVPWVNVAVAHIIWLDSGWAAWACRP